MQNHCHPELLAKLEAPARGQVGWDAIPGKPFSGKNGCAIGGGDIFEQVHLCPSGGSVHHHQNVRVAT
jgi:hypothetical protein